jgi:metal-sulfur cluster biosynthetic enzyme
MSVLRQRALEALDQVYDPELDEPITALGFVSSCTVSVDGDVEVVLQLPTPQCAPNFAYLMAADSLAALRRVPGVRQASVSLEDHFTGEEINQALGRGGGFTRAFPGETDDDELAALRQLFLRKALVARQSRLCEGLLAAGRAPAELTAARVEDLPAGGDVRRCLELRRQLGLAYGVSDPAFVRPDGQPIGEEELHRWLRSARLVRMSLEVNGGICRSLLRAHRGVQVEDPEEVLLR